MHTIGQYVTKVLYVCSVASNLYFYYFYKEPTLPTLINADQHLKIKTLPNSNFEKKFL